MGCGCKKRALALRKAAAEAAAGNTAVAIRSLELVGRSMVRDLGDLRKKAAGARLAARGGRR